MNKLVLILSLLIYGTSFGQVDLESVSQKSDKEKNEKAIETRSKFKVLFIHKFVQSIEWPEGALNDSFRIVVVKNPSMHKYVQKTSEIKKLHGLPVAVDYIDKIDDFKSGHVLYADYGDGVSSSQLFEAIGELPVVLVTEGYDYNTTMFNFVVSGNLIKYQMNRSNLEKQGLTVSKSLSNLAIELTEEDWKKELERLRTDLKVEKEKSSSLKSENEVLNTQVVNLGTQITGLESSIALLKEEIAQGKAELEEIYDRIGVQKDVYNQLVRDLDSKEEQLAQQQSLLSEKTSELESQEVAIKASERKLAEQQVQLEATTKEVIEIESKMSNALRLLENQKLVSYGIGFIAVIILFLGVVAFVNFQKQKKQALIITKQKQKVESQRDEISIQHEQLEEKSNEIKDSITYAKRIQEAILPPLRIVKENLENSFILYKPKDIVAGDFYWMEVVGNTVIFAAADCTGHGVPGAMVSVVCSNALNRSVREFERTDPGQILDKTRELVIKEFEKSEEEVKDGMDISLCALNTETRELMWAGANNPLWIATSRQLSAVSEDADSRKLTADSLSLHEVKADKQPIGKYGLETPFTTHSIQLNEGDTIYIFSDGFPDQFGGEKGKKYKSGNFKKTLLALAEKPMSEQKQLLDSEFETWRGDIEQIDDVCVIGVRV